MPANLPPTYIEAEKRYRQAKTQEEKIAVLEEMLAIIPKHKGTDKLQADLKRRLSSHRDQSKKKTGTTRHKSAFAIEKEGAAQVVITGPPNTGKSSLVARLTNASPEIAEFPHSTHKPTPGMAEYDNIQFQLVDTPPVTEDYIDPLMPDMIRRADIVVILLDVHGDLIGQYEDMLVALSSYRIFLQDTAVADTVKRPLFFKKMLVVANKADTEKDSEDFEAFIELSNVQAPAMDISVKQGRNMQKFLDTLYDISGIIRVYAKTPGKEPDLHEPFVMPGKSTLEDLAAKIHKDFARKLKFARIWGQAVHDGQMVQKDYVMHDGDVVEIHV